MSGAAVTVTVTPKGVALLYDVEVLVESQLPVELTVLV